MTSYSDSTKCLAGASAACELKWYHSKASVLFLAYISPVRAAAPEVNLKCAFRQPLGPSALIARCSVQRVAGCRRGAVGAAQPGPGLARGAAGAAGRRAPRPARVRSRRGSALKAGPTARASRPARTWPSACFCSLGVGSVLGHLASWTLAGLHCLIIAWRFCPLPSQPGLVACKDRPSDDSALPAWSRAWCLAGADDGWRATGAVCGPVHAVWPTEPCSSASAWPCQQ